MRRPSFKVMSSAVTVERQDIESPIARALISSLNAELTAAYPEPGATHVTAPPAISICMGKEL